MVSVTDNGVLARQYLHNARGERVAKLNAPSPQYHRYYVYDEAGRLLGEYRPNGTRVAEYVWLDDILVAVFSAHVGSNHQYVLTDHLATPRAVVHPGTNAIVWRWDLTGSAFGEHAVQDDPDGDGTAFTLNLRYPGQYYDGETGLHYNYFRDYDPGTGRYVQSDPIGLAAGTSTYGYVGQNSLGAIDPFGLLEWETSKTVWVNRGIWTGAMTETWPGAGFKRVPATTGARTTIPWTIDATCGCDGNGATLKEISVVFTPTVLLRKNYVDSGTLRAVRNDENQHVKDLRTWIDGARTGAETLEQTMMGEQPNGSADDCRKSAITRMNAFLAAGAAAAVSQSGQTWDASGLHAIPPGSFND